MIDYSTLKEYDKDLNFRIQERLLNPSNSTYMASTGIFKKTESDIIKDFQDSVDRICKVKIEEHNKISLDEIPLSTSYEEKEACDIFEAVNMFRYNVPYYREALAVMNVETLEIIANELNKYGFVVDLNLLHMKDLTIMGVRVYLDNDETKNNIRVFSIDKKENIQKDFWYKFKHQEVLNLVMRLESKLILIEGNND